jgi:hypothetical protein
LSYNSVLPETEPSITIMTIYVITILLLFYFSCIEVYCTKLVVIDKSVRWGVYKLLSSVAFILLVFQIGLRWQTGTDWDSYLDHFTSITSFSSTSPMETNMELGYNLLVWIVKLISNNYSIFLLIHAFIFYSFLFSSFKEYSPFFFISILVFYANTIGVLGSNRQLLALVICIYSLRFVLDKKPYKFFILVFVAFNIHASALLFALYYFVNREFRLRYVVIALIGCLIIGSTSLPFDIFFKAGSLVGGEAAGKVLLYLNDAEKELLNYQPSTTGLIKRIILMILFYYNRPVLGKKLPYYNLLLNGYSLGIAFYFLFSTSLLVMISRGSLYFTAVEPLLIASQFLMLNRKVNQYIALVFVLVLAFLMFFQSMVAYSDLFIPYKGIFINTDYIRHMY